MPQSESTPAPPEAKDSRRGFMGVVGKTGLSLAGGAVAAGLVAQDASASTGAQFPAGITFNDGASAPTSHEMALVTRASANLNFPVAIFEPGPDVSINAQASLDVMPSGSSWNLTDPNQAGITWIDLCDSSVQAVTAGNVGTARVACFSDHIELRGTSYGTAGPKDVWIVTGGSVNPHLYLSGHTGQFATYTKTPQNNASFTIWGAVNSWTPLVVAGTNGQSADLFGAYLTVNGTRGWSISNTGVPKWGNSNGQASVGAAGSAAALPATPSRYLKVIGDDGNPYVIPAYAAS